MNRKNTTLAGKVENITANTDILLGTWLRGEHLEDLAHVTAEDLPDEPRVLALLKDGLTLLDIVKLHPDRRMDLIRMSTEHSDILYKLTLADVVRKRVKRHFYDIGLDEVYKEMSFANGLLDVNDGLEVVEHLGQDLIDELKLRKERKAIPYSGLPTLTRWTGGIKKRELTTIAARPGVGKSALGLQLAVGAYHFGEKVLFYPLEMGAEQLAERILAAEQVMSPDEMRHGDVDAGKLAKGKKMLDDMTESGRFLIYRGTGCSNIETIEACIKKEHPDLVVVDQLSLLKSKRPFADARARFSYMTNTLKTIAMEQDVAIILMAQLNRGAETQEPELSNLKESGSIEEDSDNVVMIHRLVPACFEDPGAIAWDKMTPMLIKLEKQRTGRTGKFDAVFFPERTKFAEPM